MVQAAYQRPSNVAVFFTVETREAVPVADLLATDFNIYEDGQLVSLNESRQTIVNPEIAAEHYTILLVDISASVTESGQAQLVYAAASEFLSTLQAYQRVAVYAFDGAAKLYVVTPFTRSGRRTSRGLVRLDRLRGRDPSTNLHGAVVEALGELDRGIVRSRAPLRFGTLVVFTDGTDRAHRVSYGDMMNALDESAHSVYAIGVGGEIDDGTLGDIGRDGYLRVEDAGALAEGFRQIGKRIIQVMRSYYLLSYCSPARAGLHTVTVEAVSQMLGKGALSYDFDASGFRPGCDPNRPPPFDTSRLGAPRRPSRKRGPALNLEIRAQADVSVGS